MMRTANPALNANTFLRYNVSTNETMTLDGTVNRSVLLILIVMATAFYSWFLFLQSNPLVGGLFFVGLIGGFIVALITIFKKEWAMFTSPLYAAFEGLVLGGISSFAEIAYPGIVIQAVSLTFGVFLALLLAYKSNLIKATENFKLGVVAATGGIVLVYILSLLLGFVGIQIPYIFGNGIIGIGFSLFVVVIAALNLVLDFDFIEKGTESNAPKYMEWYAAFGLLVTLVWLYIEILRLLMKLRSRD